MIAIETIIPIRLPREWRLMPERTTMRGKVMPIWPPNGRGYFNEDAAVTVVMSIEENNSLRVSVSCGKKALSREECCEYIAELLPSHYVDFIPQEQVNKGFLAAVIKQRVVIGKDLAPVQHFEKQL